MQWSRFRYAPLVVAAAAVAAYGTTASSDCMSRKAVRATSAGAYVEPTNVSALPPAARRVTERAVEHGIVFVDSYPDGLADVVAVNDTAYSLVLTHRPCGQYVDGSVLVVVGFVVGLVALLALAQDVLGVRLY